MSWARINATDKPPLAYHLLNVAGMHEHLLLAREFGDVPWLHLDGTAEWRTTAREGIKDRPQIDKRRRQPDIREVRNQ